MKLLENRNLMQNTFSGNSGLKKHAISEKLAYGEMTPGATRL